MDNERILCATEYAKKKHFGQKRKDGITDYIVHPVTIAYLLREAGYDEDYIIAGLFHDLLEDTDATEEEIIRLSNVNVLNAVKLLTRRKGVSKKEYIDHILEDPIARTVKNQDRICNLLDLKQLPQGKNQMFINKYLEETRDYYFGRFSDELDSLFMEYYGNLYVSDSFLYTKDGSLDDTVTTVYKNIGMFAWMYNRQTKKWEKASPYFYAELECYAEPITKEEVQSIIAGYPEA